MVKPVMRPSYSRRLPYMSTSQAHAMADPEVGQLSLLEIGIDPDLRDRADGHQALAGLNVVAGVDVAARHDAVDLAGDVAVAQIELGQHEVAAGLLELGLGLFDGRRVGNQGGINVVEIALGILLQEDLQGLLRGRVPRRGSVSEQGRAVDRLAERLTNGREVLIEVGRHLAQVMAPGRLGGKAQADAYRIDGLQGLIDGRLGDLDRLAPLV